LKVLRDAQSYLGFLVGLPGFLRRRMTLDEASAILRQRMVERDALFLSTLRDGVLSQPHTPYPTLFRVAGCNFGDVESGVRENGLEHTLGVLRDAGVYVTFEEFKGRAPIVRGGREIPATEESFDNRTLRRSYQISTGGSTGAGRSVAVDLKHMWARVPDQLVSDTIQGFQGSPQAIWFDGLPGNGVNSLLLRIPSGTLAERWFSPTLDRQTRPAFKFRAAQKGILTVARLSGVNVPRLEPVGLDQAGIVAEWAARTVQASGTCGVRTLMSRALRVCLAAEELGMDLTGVTFSGGGEPPTPAKVAAVRRTGARLMSNYTSQEAGPIGHMCMTASDPNDQHLMMHHLAMVTRVREVPGFAGTVDALCYTTLLPSARKLMLNVETDDCAVVERRPCGCPWEEYGFTTHMRGIHSFQKLTGEGVSLLGNDLVDILETVLPNRFGGSPLDYQLHEEEDDRGFTRLIVVISPRLADVDEAAVVETVLASLATAGHAAAISGAIWGQAGTLKVRREEPTWTARGKLMPLHLNRHPKGSSSGGGALEGGRA